jgi:LysM repeat protein
MKRILAIVLIALVAISLSACTRDKPDVLPAATVVVKLDPGTPPAGTLATPAVPEATPVLSSVVTATAVIPTITPSTSGAPSATTSLTGTMGTCPTVYTVQWGDTLNRVSAKYGVSVAAIGSANPGLNPNFISVGQTINVPCPEQALPPSAFPTAGPPPSSSSASSSIAQPPATSCQPTYTVQRGDWTYALARRFGISVQALMSANPSVNVNYLYPGQVLNVPCGSMGNSPPGQPSSGKTHVVQTGDTLFSIAVRFNTTVYALQIANNLPNPQMIYAGQTLIIP